jgi:hypothetical protein
MGGRASPRAAPCAGLPDNRLARTLALPVSSQLQASCPGCGRALEDTEWEK